MLEQSQQDFTISYFCRLILLHNLNDWQSVTEEQKMCWTREGISIEHWEHYYLLFPAQIFSIRAPQKHRRRQRWSITVPAEQSFSVQLLSDWCHCPFYFPVHLLRAWQVFKLHLLTFQIAMGCAFIHSNCLDFLFFFFFFFQMETIWKETLQ